MSTELIINLRMDKPNKKTNKFVRILQMATVMPDVCECMTVKEYCYYSRLNKAIY